MKKPLLIFLSALSASQLLVAQENEPAEAPPGVEPVEQEHAVPKRPVIRPARPVVRPAQPVERPAEPREVNNEQAQPPLPGANRMNGGIQLDDSVDPNGIYIAKGKVEERMNMDDIEVADLYYQLTGKRVLLSSSTQGMEFRFHQRGPLTNRQGAILLEKLLNMENYAFVPSGENEVKLVPKGAGTTTASQEGTLYITDYEDLPEGDVFVTYKMNLQYIKPEEAVRNFTQMVGSFSEGGKITPVPNAAAVIITEKTPLIRFLEEVRESIDVPSQSVGQRFISLIYADAEELAATLNEIMNSQQQAKTSAGVKKVSSNNNAARPPGVQSGGAAAGGDGSSAGEDIPVQIIPDMRTNRILVMGRPIDIMFVERLIHEFDSAQERSNFLKRKLRFMRAADFMDVAATALESLQGTNANSSGSSRGNNNRSNNSTNNTRNNTSNNNSSGSGTSRGNSLSSPTVSDAPESMLIGKTLLVADNLTNSIIVQGPPESLRVISGLLDEMDTQPLQVMISTVFGQLNLTDNLQYGIDWLQTYDGSGGGWAGGNTNGVTNSGVDIKDLVTASAFPTSSGLNLYGTTGDLNVYIKAMESNNDFEVISRPTVYTANNRMAVISSGQRVAVPTNSFTSGGGSNATQSTNIEYRDVVLKLEVVPLINSKNEVTMEIALLNDQIVGSQTVDTNEVPIIGTEEITTTVTVRNNDTVVLGGLVTETHEDNVTGIPIISHIPGIGNLFKSTKIETKRRELLIFIQPQIVANKSDEQAVQDDIAQRYVIDDKAKSHEAAGVLPAKALDNYNPAEAQEAKKNSESLWNRNMRRR